MFSESETKAATWKIGTKSCERGEGSIISLIFPTRKVQGMNTLKVMQSKYFSSGWFEWMHFFRMVLIFIMTSKSIVQEYYANQPGKRQKENGAALKATNNFFFKPHHDTVPTCQIGDGWQVFGWQIRSGFVAASRPVWGFPKPNEYSSKLQPPCALCPHTWSVRKKLKVVKYKFPLICFIYFSFL